MKLLKQAKIALLNVMKKTLKPMPKMDLVEWADEYRYLSPEGSSEPGKFKTGRVEAARGPMLAVTKKGVKKITAVCCTQIFKTEFIVNIVGYFIHQDPCPMIYMAPTEGMAETWSTDRLDTLIRDNPCLHDLVADKKSRDSGNTKDYKKFVGGYIAMIGSNSPSELAMRPVRIVLCDETDKYPKSAGKEGDPIKLITERSDTFWNALIVHVCSPTIDGDSRIMEEYEQSNQQIPFVDCPHCKKPVQMTGDKFFEYVQWEKGKPEEANIFCPECGEEWREVDRQKAIKKITWVALKPEITDHEGFLASKLISPWKSMSWLAKKWEEAKGRPEKEKTFYNTQLAMPYKEAGDAPEWERLYDRREQYEIGKVPNDVVFLTMGVDVQQDRLEAEVVGWCRNRRSYSIDYRVLHGDTANDEVWEKLENLIYERFRHEKGFDLPIKLTAIDTGYRTQKVYSFCRKFQTNQVVAIKGQDNSDTPIKQPRPVDVKVNGKTKRRGLKLWTIGVSILKTELYSFLKQWKKKEDENFPDGYCHFPEYEDEYFKQLTAEQLCAKIVKGYTKYEWTKTRDRNEALDCRIYATAASLICGISRFKEAKWKKLEENRIPPSAVLERTPKIEKKKRVRRPSSFW